MSWEKILGENAVSLAYEIVSPDPAGTIQSLSSLGYTTEAAVADIIDNSVAHVATTVSVDASWEGDDSWLAVVDDGCGMDAAGLVRGLTVGGRGLDARSEADLGRFGMGLKTASFSQAKQLIVASRPDGGDWNVRTWDVDEVLRLGEWRLLKGCPPEAVGVLSSLSAKVNHSGTVVLWRRLTRLVSPGSRPDDEWARRAFHNQLEAVEKYLGMAFHRYITGGRKGGVRINLNGRAIVPWDPFLPRFPCVETLPSENPVPGVLVQGYVLPHRSRLTEEEQEFGGGPGGWLAQQGFYVYRRDRLIVAGDWLRLPGLRKDERHTLARIRVELPPERDSEWGLDVRKSTASPPPALVGHLRRVARATRERASAVVAHRGRVVRDSRSAPEDFTWRQVKKHGQVNFLINRSHPLVEEVLAVAPEYRHTVETLLRMLEASLPVGVIRSTPEAAADVIQGSDVPDDIAQMASRVLESLLNKGIETSEAVARVASMPPFSDYSNVLSGLTRQEEDEGT